MSERDKPDEEPSTDNPDAHPAKRSGQDLDQLPPAKSSLSAAWRKRSPARGLILAIPAGVALWVAVIYLFAKLI